MTARAASGALDAGSSAIDEEADPAFAAEALPAQIKTLEALLKSDPGNVRILSLASQGYAGYALLFAEDSDPARARDFYLRARNYGLRALERRGYPGLASKTPAEIEAAVSRAGKGDVRALFWTGLSWAGWINLAKDDPAAVADLPRAVAVMKRALELEPDYYFGGPELFFGTYYGRPRVFGGDPAKSKEHFEKAAAASGGRFLLTWVRYARVYAVSVQDKELYKSLLKRALDGAPDALPEARLANEVARRQAKAWLEKADELFE